LWTNPAVDLESTSSPQHPLGVLAGLSARGEVGQLTVELAELALPLCVARDYAEGKAVKGVFAGQRRVWG
jgi:hypothetical protein